MNFQVIFSPVQIIAVYDKMSGIFVLSCKLREACGRREFFESCAQNASFVFIPPKFLKFVVKTAHFSPDKDVSVNPVFWSVLFVFCLSCVGRGRSSGRACSGWSEGTRYFRKIMCIFP